MWSLRLELGILALLRLPEDPADHAEDDERGRHHPDDEHVQGCGALVEEQHQSSSRRRTFSASRSASTSRSVASSRLRHWLRSSWATARMTGPARARTLRFWVSVSDGEPSTSKVASTRVSLFCACWPPGPLEREKRSSISERGMETDRVTRRRRLRCRLEAPPALPVGPFDLD